LQKLVHELFGADAGTPSIHLHHRAVSLQAEKPAGAEKQIERFEQTTGFQVQFKNGKNASSGPGDETIFQVETAGKRMENNEAIEETKRWAQERGFTIYKVGIKQEVVEVHFISPEVAARHEADLEELSWRIGRPVTYNKHPKQNEIIRITLESLPPTWEPKKNPSILMNRKTVALKLAEMPSEKEKEKVAGLIKKETGYHLEIVT
jgi:hypothetical protein